MPPPPPPPPPTHFACDPACLTGRIGVHAVLKERGLEMLSRKRLKVEAGLITEVETLLIPGDSKIVGYQQEDLTRPSRLWSLMVGAAFFSEIFAVSQGKIAEIHAFCIPSEGNVRTPWASGSVPVRDW